MFFGRCETLIGSDFSDYRRIKYNMVRLHLIVCRESMMDLVGGVSTFPQHLRDNHVQQGIQICISADAAGLADPQL